MTHSANPTSKKLNSSSDKSDNIRSFEDDGDFDNDYDDYDGNTVTHNNASASSGQNDSSSNNNNKGINSQSQLQSQSQVRSQPQSQFEQSQAVFHQASSLDLGLFYNFANDTKDSHSLGVVASRSSSLPAAALDVSSRPGTESRSVSNSIAAAPSSNHGQHQQQLQQKLQSQEQQHQ